MRSRLNIVYHSHVVSLAFNVRVCEWKVAELNGSSSSFGRRRQFIVIWVLGPGFGEEKRC